MVTRVETRYRSKAPSEVNKGRPGGRTEKNRKAVAVAVLELIKAGNIDFEIQEVAALSGVHRTTIFRRWPNRDALIATALAEHNSKITFDITGDFEADLRGMALKMRDFLANPIEQAITRLAAGTDSVSFREQSAHQWMPIAHSFIQPILAAQASGIVDTEVDAGMVVSAVISTLLVQIIFLNMPPDDALVERLVTQILRGCRPVHASDDMSIAIFP